MSFPGRPPDYLVQLPPWETNKPHNIAPCHFTMSELPGCLRNFKTMWILILLQLKYSMQKWINDNRQQTNNKWINSLCCCWLVWCKNVEVRGAAVLWIWNWIILVGQGMVGIHTININHSSWSRMQVIPRIGRN